MRATRGGSSGVEGVRRGGWRPGGGADGLECNCAPRSGRTQSARCVKLQRGNLKRGFRGKINSKIGFGNGAAGWTACIMVAFIGCLKLRVEI